MALGCGRKKLVSALKLVCGDGIWLQVVSSDSVLLLTIKSQARLVILWRRQSGISSVLTPKIETDH